MQKHRGVTKRTLWRSKMNDIPILLEHVDLLNGLDRLDVELLERGLQFLVVGAGCLVHFLDLSPWCAFPSE